MRPENGQIALVLGNNEVGQLGLGDTVDRNAPAEVSAGPWSSVSAGASHTCAVAYGQSRALFCWGDNTAGELGVGDNNPRRTSTQVGQGRWWRVDAGVFFTCALDFNKGGWAPYPCNINSSVPR